MAVTMTRGQVWEPVSHKRSYNEQNYCCYFTGPWEPGQAVWSTCQGVDKGVHHRSCAHPLYRPEPFTALAFTHLTTPCCPRLLCLLTSRTMCPSCATDFPRAPLLSSPVLAPRPSQLRLTLYREALLFFQPDPDWPHLYPAVRTQAESKVGLGRREGKGDPW